MPQKCCALSKEPLIVKLLKLSKHNRSKGASRPSRCLRRFRSNFLFFALNSWPIFIDCIGKRIKPRVCQAAVFTLARHCSKQATYKEHLRSPLKVSYKETSLRKLNWWMFPRLSSIVVGQLSLNRRRKEAFTNSFANVQFLLNHGTQWAKWYLVNCS